MTAFKTRVRVSTRPENLNAGPRYELWFGQNLRAARENLELSQEELGKRCSMNRTCLGRIELNGHGVSMATAQILATCVGMDLKQLLVPPAVFLKSLPER